jgi:dTDP-glucose pyrophosphorylase
MTNSLYSQKKDQYVKELMIFFKKVNQSQIVWINQSKPLGFGHAVLQSKSYVGNNRFLLHAGDTILLSKNNNHLKKLIQCHLKNKSVASFIVQKINDPRHYGVIDGKTSGNIIKVTNLEEKPLRPKTNLAILPLYIFEPIIFQYIKNLKPTKHGEIQLTDAIINMVKDGLNVYAVDLTKEILHMDIGNPQSYWDSLNMSYKNIKQN